MPAVCQKVWGELGIKGGSIRNPWGRKKTVRLIGEEKKVLKMKPSSRGDKGGYGSSGLWKRGVHVEKVKRGYGTEREHGGDERELIAAS